MGTAREGIVRAVGTKQGGGKQIFTATVEVFDDAGKMIATGQGTYRYLSTGSQHPEKEPRHV
jgi:acyl-coenzyme A thioesterase PaaI-like protein